LLLADAAVAAAARAASVRFSHLFANAGHQVTAVAAVAVAVFVAAAGRSCLGVFAVEHHTASRLCHVFCAPET